MTLVTTLPLGVRVERDLWEIKTIGLAVILIYAFFKFAWSYRLFNYVAILYGAMPPREEKDRPETEVHVQRTARMFESAGLQFNRRAAGVFLCTRLSWLVCRTCRAHAEHSGNSHCDVAAPVRVRLLQSDAEELARRRKQFGRPASEPVDQQAYVFVRGIIEIGEVRVRARFDPCTAFAPRLPVDRVRLDIEACRAKRADGARHMRGGRHHNPPFTGLRVRQSPAELGILNRVTRLAFERYAAAVDAETLE